MTLKISRRLGRLARRLLSTRWLTAKDFMIAFLTCVLIATSLLPAAVASDQGIRVAIEPKVTLRLNARTVLQLHERFRDFADAIPAAETWGMDEVLAFEENPHFAYLWGDSTKVLIQAGNANEERRSGPPRVKEEELRADFLPGFEFLWLKTTHFDTGDPNNQGALAWSVLLRRK